MFRYLRHSLFPRIDPELDEPRIRHAKRLFLAIFILLAFWLLSEAFVWFSLEAMDLADLTFDLIWIISMGVAGGIAFWLINQGRVVASGYLMVTTFFIFTSINIILFPFDLQLMSGAFVLAILIIGTIVGGGSVYPFAVGALIVILAAWFRGRSLMPNESNFQPYAGYVFLTSQALIYFSLAVALDIFSRRIQHTVGTLRRQAEDLSELAHTDPLTGLPNRRQFLEQLDREFSRARRYNRPLSLLFIDLDGFKEVNDRFGHMVGDEILRGAAQSLRASLRASDLLARIGGDEFAILLPETRPDGATHVASRLRKAMEAYAQSVRPRIPHLSFCGGISQLLDEDTSTQNMLNRADKAQYLAKASGKGQTRTQQDVEMQLHPQDRSNPMR